MIFKMFFGCNSVVFVLILIFYLLFGSYFFWSLEHQHYAEHLKFIKSIQKDIKDILLKPNVSGYELSQRRGLLRNISILVRHDLLEENEQKNPLNFYNCLFFTVSVVTSIGYGNIAPKTVEGKFFTIIYAFIGIPLTGIILKMLMDLFVAKTKNIYKKVKSQQATTRKIGLLYYFLFLLMLGFSIFVFIPSAVFGSFENWNFVDSVYFALTSLMTIGIGDYVPGIDEGGDSVWIWVYKIFIILWLFGGMGYLMMILSFITDQVINKEVHRVIETVTRRVHLNDDFERKDPKNEISLEEFREVFDAQSSFEAPHENSQIFVTKDYLIKRTAQNQADLYQEHITTRRYSETELSLFQVVKRLEQDPQLQLNEKYFSHDKDESKYNNLNGNDKESSENDLDNVESEVGKHFQNIPSTSSSNWRDHEQDGIILQPKDMLLQRSVDSKRSSSDNGFEYVQETRNRVIYTDNQVSTNAMPRRKTSRRKYGVCDPNFSLSSKLNT